MRNSFWIEGDTARIILTRRNGERMVTIIDAVDLPRLNGYRLFAKWNPHTGSWYSRARKVDGENTAVARLILGVTGPLVVDHLNHDTLDNRRNNLVAKSNARNQLNRKGPNSTNNSSGIRGVNWDARAKKWKARVTVDGRCHHLGMFASVTVAGDAVREFLQKVSHA